MKFDIIEWPLLKLYKLRDKIDFPVYQRGDVWSLDNRRRLIDSILRGIDIPKIYLQKNSDNESWDCIDGHQRIDTIVGFFDGAFDFDGRTFMELSKDEQETIEEYELTIVEVTEISDIEVRDLFERLQLGMPLNSGEKLNAIMSNLRDFVKEMAATNFIKKLSIPTRRFSKEQLCAQLCNNSRLINKKGEFINSKFEDLRNLYRTKADFSQDSYEAKFIMSVLEKLDELFGYNAKRFRNKAMAVSVYLFVEEKMLDNSLKNKEKLVTDFFMKFLDALQEEVSLGIGFKNRFLKEFQKWVIQGADSKGAITQRYDSLNEAFDHFESHNEIIVK